MTESHLRPINLRCEYLIDPQGIDVTDPRLSWSFAAVHSAARQTAYRIQVASSAAKLAAGIGDLWDSGKVYSDQTQQVVYAGVALQSRMQCYWQLVVWDETYISTVSEPACWSMGLLDSNDWSASWIAADPTVYMLDSEASAGDKSTSATPVILRRQVDLPDGIIRATLYASARGLFSFSIGDQRVGEDIFAPEWTDYRKRIHYRTYDVTHLLQAGDNMIHATLGDGWWSGYVGWQETRGRYGLRNSLFAQLEVELETGERRIIATDANWECSTGPIISSDFMMGEYYDARREFAITSGSSATPSGWCRVELVSAPDVPLVAQRAEPVSITRTLQPQSIRKVADQTYLFDLGQNIAGWVRICVDAPEGTLLTLRHGERLDTDGRLYTENLRRARSTDVYICNGSGHQIWQPNFTFHGFQYVEIHGMVSDPDADTVLGCMINSALPETGKFSCGHAGVNRLWLNGLWSQRDNFLSVPTDCPQRDERLGWTGDAQVFLRTASYNMDIAAFFSKWMVDIEDAQTADGIFPDTAPRLAEDGDFVGLDGLGGAAGWADAGIIVPHSLWRLYADEGIIRKHWNAMEAWMDYLERTNPRGIRSEHLGNNYGDWLCIPADTTFRTQSPMKNLLATAFWADDAAKMAEMATVIGDAAAAAKHHATFLHVRDAFQREFLLADGRLQVETQTAYLLALAMNLLPEDVRGRAAAHLVANIGELGWHLSTGFIGIRYLNPILTEFGYADVAYCLLLKDDYPSWLYPVKHGATTIWERWNGWTEAEGFFNPHMNSFNHYSLGSIGEWLFRYVGGIEMAPQSAGFKQFVLKPYPDARLGYADVSFRSPHGVISSHWRYEGTLLTWSFRIPANTTAWVHIPCSPYDQVSINGGEIPADARQDGNYRIFWSDAGEYSVVIHP